MSYEEEKQDRKIDQLGAEIERLRANEKKLGTLCEEFDSEVRHLKEILTHSPWHDLQDDLKCATARIQELEELNAALMKNEASLRTAAAKYRKRAQAAEAKIGTADECPDDLPPIGSPHRSWQITDARLKAIRWAAELQGDCEAGDVLRAMLEDVEG